MSRAIYTLTIDMVDGSGPLRRSFYFTAESDRAEFLRAAELAGLRPRIVSRSLERLTTAAEALRDANAGQRSLLDAF